MEGKNVALLGATGFLGKQILLELVDNGFRVTVVSRNDENHSVPFPIRILNIKKFLSCKEPFDLIIN